MKYFVEKKNDDVHVSVFIHVCIKQHLFDEWEKRLTIHLAYSFDDNYYEIDE